MESRAAIEPRASAAALPLFGSSLSVWMQVLANRTPDAPFAPEDMWAMWRLGMFISICNAKIALDDWRVHFSKAAAYAACRRFDEARSAIGACLRHPQGEAERIHLAARLWHYMPKEALQLVENDPRLYPGVRVALLMRNGKFEQARHVLDTLPADAETRWPELLLFRTNLCAGSPQEQLLRLNGFLQAWGLAPVSLRDASQPPSPMNVVPSAPLPAVDGPLVSVLMPTFRTPRHIGVAIESVLSQSWRNLELIVVDDASGDETLDVVRGWMARDDRVRLVPLPSNVGTAAAQRIALDRARGDFITGHDSDDWSHPGKIARQMELLLADERLVATHADMLRLADNGQIYGMNVYPLLTLNTSSLLFRREPVLRRAGTWDLVRGEVGFDTEYIARLRVVFGEDAVKDMGFPSAFFSHRADSLMNATYEGFPSATGVAMHRLVYWDDWMRWHIDTMARGGTPYVSMDFVTCMTDRPFPVDPKYQVSRENMERCLEALA